MRTFLLTLVLALLTMACTDSGTGPVDRATADSGPADRATADGDVTGQTHPDILSAQLTAAGDGTWNLAATVSSPYDTPQRYADAFRALTLDGTELGVRVLTHDHAAEQPFTRTLTGLTIPEGATQITVEGRDLANGWGGDTVTIPVPR